MKNKAKQPKPATASKSKKTERLEPGSREPESLSLTNAGVSPTPSSKPQPPSAKPQKAARRLSAIDAAARVLSDLPAKEVAQGLSIKELIQRMHTGGLWTSPNGRTPEASLYSGIIREITKKKTTARFRKVSPGRFAAGPVSDAVGHVVKSASRPISSKKAKVNK